MLGWANGDMDLVKDCAQTVLRVAKAILKDLTPEAIEPEDTVKAGTRQTTGTAGDQQ